MPLSLIPDWPPLVVFEVDGAGVTAIRRNPKTLDVEARADRELAPGVLEVTPGHPNVRDPDVFGRAIAELVDELGPLSRPEAGLILPDGSSRLTVLEFDELPGKAEEREKLIRFRLAKSVPFDIETARLAYQLEKRGTMRAAVVAVTADEVVRQYERALQDLDLWPGFVSLSMASALNLAPREGMALFAKRSGHAMTMAAVEDGHVRMVRGVDLAPVYDHDDPYRVLDDMLTDLYPTLVFVADNLGAPVSRLSLCGFGELLQPALERFPQELGCEVEPTRTPNGVVGPRDAGVWGYLAA